MPRTNRPEARARHRLRPDRHRPGVRVRLLRLAGVQGAARRGARGRARQQQPGDDHDRPRAGRSHLRRAADAGGARRDHRARASRRDSADGRRPDRLSISPSISPTPATLDEVQRQADWRLDRGDQDRRGSAAVQGRDALDRPRRAAERPRHGRWPRRSSSRARSAFRSSSGRRSRSAASAAASPTTSRSSASSPSAASS